METKHILATYGTLKKGFGNNRLLSESEFISEGLTKDKYVMTSNGHYPYVSKFPNHLDNTHISVEVYSLTPMELQMCDYLEGNGSHYTREEIDIVLLDGSEIKSWLYFNQHPHGNTIPSGIFK